MDHLFPRAAATAVMWNLVAPGGVLLVVEDGSAKGSHTVRSARQLVLSSAASSSATRSKVSSGGGKGSYLILDGNCFVS